MAAIHFTPDHFVSRYAQTFAIAIATMAVFLSLASTAQAEIVYTQTDVQLTNNTPYNLDLNNDGITDFTLLTYVGGGGGCDGGWTKIADLKVTTAQGNGVAMLKNGWVAKLRPGVEIGSNQSFGPGPSMAEVEDVFYEQYHHVCVHAQFMRGPWLQVHNRYLGLQFQISGQTHYGWAALQVQSGYVYIQATLTGYAYETTPGQSIVAGATQGSADEWEFVPDALLTHPIPDTPQPVSLRNLALDAQNVGLWRREEEIGVISLPA